MEIHSKQSSTKESAIVAEGYQMCQCFSYMHPAAGFSALPQKKKKKERHDFRRFNMTGEWQI